MPEPQIYDAAGEATRLTAAQMRDYVPPKDRPEERDAIWNFENIPNALQEQTDLRGWMLKDEATRLDLVKTWIRAFARREGEDVASHVYRKNRIRRCLLFVIGTEAADARGNRAVAAEAFKALFPKE